MTLKYVTAMKKAINEKISVWNVKNETGEIDETCEICYVNIRFDVDIRSDVSHCSHVDNLINDLISDLTNK